MLAPNNNNKNVRINQKYTPPQHKKSAFHCPHCEVYANQRWSAVSHYKISFILSEMDLYLKTSSYNHQNLLQTLQEICSSLYIKDSDFSFCHYCKKYSVWVERKMVYPHSSPAPLPIEEMPKSVKEIYNEARNTVNQSPRGACALLRLAIEKLVKELGENESNLSKSIGNGGTK